MRHNYLKNTHEVPTPGGTYTEGILKSNASTLSDSITNLTHIGLTRLGKDGSIQPAIAKSWETSPDGKIYTFHLEKKYNADEILKYFRDQKGSWLDIAINAPDKNTLVFTLKKPFGLFIASTLKPILPYGPYKIQKEEVSQITLIKNTDLPFFDPYLEKVVFKIYPNIDQLQNDLKSGKILATDEDLPKSPKCCQKYSVKISRRNVAFINTERIPDKAIRKQIINGPAFPEPKKLTLLRSNGDSAAKFSQELIKKFKANNVQITEKVSETLDLLTVEADNKQYDILVYGVKTGYYDDLYNYFHTSQIPPSGMNYSMFKNKASDRLIEESRLTLDPKIRGDKFTQAKAIILDESVAIFQTDQPYQFYTSKMVKGIDFSFVVTQANRFTFIDKWYIKTKRVPNK